MSRSIREPRRKDYPSFSAWADAHQFWALTRPLVLTECDGCGAAVEQRALVNLCQECKRDLAEHSGLCEKETF